MTDNSTIEITFSLAPIPKCTGNIGIEDLRSKYEAFKKITLAIERVYQFLYVNKDCHVKSYTDCGIVVSGPKAKLQRFLNNKTAVEIT